MSELGLTPVSRTRVDLPEAGSSAEQITRIELVSVYKDADGRICERPYGGAVVEAG